MWLCKMTRRELRQLWVMASSQIESAQPKELILLQSSKSRQIFSDWWVTWNCRDDSFPVHSPYCVSLRRSECQLFLNLGPAVNFLHTHHYICAVYKISPRNLQVFSTKICGFSTGTRTCAHCFRTAPWQQVLQNRRKFSWRVTCHNKL